ncbi:MAG: hypothetical protein K940chlam2_00653 [Chlamydiae bacterium]|nr:hypothetical protein [Chlamydiota bacterium]
MIEGALILWFTLTILSLGYVLWDQYTNTPSMRIMTLAWALIILYMGPVGLFIYFTSCRQPLPGTHDAFIAAHWKQAVGSLIHCIAGDATAIIALASVLYFTALPNGTEVIIEYIAAYLFGLFIFQALFMRSMFATYREAVMKSIFAETVSMNFVMAGMFPVIVIVKHFLPEASNPATLLFWGMMSLATLVGFALAYPINSWMVKRGVKHGMMSKPQGEKEIHHNMHEHMEPTKLSPALTWGLVIGTYAFFIGAMIVTGCFVPIQF